MLDDRKATILRAVVTEYIETAQPVGSGHVAKAPDVTVSSATVRNDMAALEAEGYLDQPHTSAGRIPTEKGYRFFVDHLGGPGRLGATETQQVRTFFSRTHGEIEQMLSDTSRLLSQLTRYAAVVVGPPHEVATIKSVQLVSLTARVVLVVLVLSNGAIEKHTIELDDDVDELVVNAAGVRLASMVIGRSLADAASVEVDEDLTRPASSPAGADGVGSVVRAAMAALRGEHRHDDQVYIGGTSDMAAAFDAVGTVSEILRILEQQLVVVSLLEDVLDRGLSVAIGTETGNQALADCSLVVAPYVVDGEAAGSIGVLGPTRMHYSQALAAVAVVSNRLGRRLSEG
ncbi:heat-inducible transcriptional repressor HrcA [Rhabdothermincola salaria]|uniref:heat-inducible transcriptional repressor HrcA n=1 Tax=Rhabdothermincola salaria TaxID=2903142 RepID=UPI001E4A9FE9|nr:heat-inducible transcriptional repressor HrcA [Rhabdothermincola salaria]MCD9622685.1 heat-inducible transcriptional repressor HrcA [Rhabdothermincola salaria]